MFCDLPCLECYYIASLFFSILMLDALGVKGLWLRGNLDPTMDLDWKRHSLYVKAIM